MVGYVRPANGSEQDAVSLAELLDAVFRHHGAGALVGVAGPVVFGELKSEAEPARGRVEYAQRLGHGLLADAIAGNDGDPVRLGHVRALRCS